MEHNRRISRVPLPEEERLSLWKIIFIVLHRIWIRQLKVKLKITLWLIIMLTRCILNGTENEQNISRIMLILKK